MSAPEANILDRARRFFGEGIWTQELRQGSVGSAAVRLLQLVTMIAEGFVRDRLLLRASALTYMAILALIPALAVALSIVQAIGVSENLAELAVDQVAAGSPEAKEQILALVKGANIGGLGTIGAALLLMTTVLALRHGEEALNEIWGVTKGRSWSRRFTDYLAVLVVTPLLAGVALSLGAMLQSDPVVRYLLSFPLFSTLYQLGLNYAPILLLALAFTFIYWFLPNTAVQLRSALLGGVVAALLFSAARYLYIDFNVGVARYDAIFGGFAALPLLLVWFYVSAAIVLLGAEVCFAYQNLAHYRREIRGGPLAPAEREAVGVRIATAVARAFRDAGPPHGAPQLSDELDVPVRAVRELLKTLEDAGIVSALANDDGDDVYQLGRPAERILVQDVLLALRGEREAASGPGPATRAVDDLLEELDARVADVASSRTLADLLASADSAD